TDHRQAVRRGAARGGIAPGVGHRACARRAAGRNHDAAHHAGGGNDRGVCDGRQRDRRFSIPRRGAMRIVALPEAWGPRAIVIAEVTDPHSWLTAGELAVVDEFQRQKRREEWMVSRIAEKELRRRGARGACVSYSHSGAYGAAAVDETP